MVQLKEARPGFWDTLAPVHARIEDNYFDRRSLRHIAARIQAPVLVVGAGQGLLVAELQKQGFQCDGIDLSSEMVRYARARRGLALIHADAKALPFVEGSYQTIIYATGVLDFILNEDEIAAILNEGRRVAGSSGEIFAGFYRLSSVQEDFLKMMGLLRNNLLAHRETLGTYLLNPFQTVAWIADRSGAGRLHAAGWLVRLAVRSTMREKCMALRMQRLFRKIDARALIAAASARQPYRNEMEIRNLFGRLAIPLKHLDVLPSCCIARV